MARKPSISRGEVPYLPVKRIERDAELLLAEYAEAMEAITSPPVPIEEFFGLILPVKFEFMDLKERFPSYADVHGAIWFGEARIGIDRSLHPDEFSYRRNRYHFTLAHEIAHWRLHRQHYITNPAERRLFEDGTPKPDVVCRSSERKKPVEWQADQYAARLLMPRKLIFEAWPEFAGQEGSFSVAELYDQLPEFRGNTVFHRGRILSDVEKEEAMKEVFCKHLADKFEVSAEAMKYRLVDLGLIIKEKARTLF